ncbi:type I restriction enzyme M protein [Weissella oryzae SG25]|uniref:site-specific DNA-methyltransferase (adenine-specific) n=1 Tax=Weissella oryzae (strain DSM 25784 / JCM 18191 / LMG 30913 / SG25) TaxID=1329250 RepID=A0A069CRF3_WEIOS|nr:type I restriction-modification system subunit M [Weissella oryzae]GAK29927.1 type I restriction enzyme M protein [Weissella oryzae SG25]
MITSEEIKARLWDGATELRGSMDASRYKDYMLGLMFYKFLSDKTLETFASTAGLSKDDNLLEEYTKAHEEYGVELDKMIQGVLGYFVLPEYLYQTWIKDINAGDFEVQKVIDSLNDFERTIASNDDQNNNPNNNLNDDFKGIFSNSTMDLTDTALGSGLNERSKNIKALIQLFEDLDMVALQKGDVLGDAYEYLIGQFAMESGKKAGEFYTPRQVSEVMAQIVARTQSIKTIYDPTVGSGSLLLTVKKYLNLSAQRDLNYYGQEKNTATYNLTRMNLLLHGVRPEKMTINNGDTLSQDWPEDPKRSSEGIQFDAVVMNPPYSLKNWNKSGLKVTDPRFEIAGILPPDAKGDFAFLLHGLFHLGQQGTMAIVLPHGVLFRGGSEGEIRKRLIEKNQIDAVIGLPSNLFTNTGIPVCVMILKKNRALTDPIQIIDASRNFVKIGKQNVLQEKDIAKIVDTYVEKQEIDGYSHLSTQEEIIANEYNLNIPRYVVAIDDEISQDVDAHLLGGIPRKNIADLKNLNTIVGDVFSSYFTEIRTNYVELNESVSDIRNVVLNDSRVQSKSETLKAETAAYVQKYWRILHSIDKNTNLTDLKDKMLIDIKQLLSTFDNIDIYAGYQVIAEVWQDTLTHDSELIAMTGFYETGRSREKNMVKKGKGKDKEEVQDGWIGTIVPNELLAKRLYSDELEAIENKKSRIAEINNELAELIEATKVEDSDEYNALYETLKKNDEGEAQSSFEKKKVNTELKLVIKDSPEYNLLKNVDKLIVEKTAKNKAIKNETKALNEIVYERILNLTNEEIDNLIFEKWFGNTVTKIVALAEVPLKVELDTLEMLNERYSTTLAEIDAETSRVEKEFEKVLSELEVM